MCHIRPLQGNNTPPPCTKLLSPQVCLNLKGGTNADMAPQIDEFTEIFLPNIAKFGFEFEFEVVRKGFYPKVEPASSVIVASVQCRCFQTW